MSQLPFSPFSSSLREVLLEKYIKGVAKWLLGKEENSILAQASNSSWESALTILFLSEVDDILSELGDQEKHLQKEIQYKSAIVARWLLSKKVVDGQYICWEKVTWDTSVVIQALVIALKKYGSRFSKAEGEEILHHITSGTKWLYRRFTQWETEVKYPFGPADVAQIVIALITIAENYPNIYEEVCSEYGFDSSTLDIVVEIVEYLIYRKIEQRLSFQSSGKEGEVIAYWWDDFFNTAEVVYALAVFHQYASRKEHFVEKYRDLLSLVEDTIIRACAYFEHEQVDGMWGSHIDTVRVLQAYTYVRRIIPQQATGREVPLITPEIHTIFKALRWACDEKQIFSDGSMLHTMFLTIFYAMALVEIYHSWDPAKKTVAEIYDDVLWYTPVRTTPERIRRLSAELHIKEMEKDISLLRNDNARLTSNLDSLKRNQLKIVAVSTFVLFSIPLFVSLGSLFGVVKFSLQPGENFWEYIAVFITIFLGVLTLIWNYDDFLHLK